MRYKSWLVMMVFLTIWPVAAQSADLAGVWQFTDKHGTKIRVELAEQGNSWVGSSLSKLQAELKLNPAGLRNQWVGDLTLEETHSVKADLKAGKLKLTDLDDGESWTFTRSK